MAEAAAETTAGATGDTAQADAGAASEASSDYTPLVDWNGEIESLRTSDWYRSLDPKAGDPLLRGIEAKYQNYERRYKPAYETQARRQKELDEREQRLLDDEKRVMKLWYGDEDPRTAHQAAVEKLRQDHEARVAQIVEQHRAELEGARKPTPELEAKLRRLDEAEAELRKVTEARTSAESRLATIEKAETDAALDAFEEWLGKAAPHLIGETADEKGFDALISLIDRGVEPERALRMVLAEYPSPAPKPEPLSPGMRAMGKGSDTRTEKHDPVDLHEAMERLRRQHSQPWSGR